MHVTVYEHETKHLLEMDKAQELVHLIRIDLITSLVMALVATGENGTSTPSTLKAKNDDSKVVYSPSIGDDGDDAYQFAQFKVSTQFKAVEFQPYSSCSL